MINICLSNVIEVNGTFYFLVLQLMNFVNLKLQFMLPLYQVSNEHLTQTLKLKKHFFFLKKAISSVSTVGAHSEASSAPNQKQGLVKSEELKEAYLAKTKKQKAG